MFDVTCKNNKCADVGQTDTFLGDEPYVMCGKCGQTMQPENVREDPEQPQFKPGAITK